MAAEVRNIVTQHRILSIDRIVFVGLDEDGSPVVHGFTDAASGAERVPTS